MSYSFEQLSDIEAAGADFEEFLSSGDFHNAAVVVENLRDRGYETEAMFLHRKYLRALTGGSYEDGLVSDRTALAEEVY